MLCLPLCLLLLAGCDDFLEMGEPFGQIPHEQVFQDQATATAAVTTMYARLRDEVLLTGTSSGLSVAMGLYADELDYYGMPWEPSHTFFHHQIVGSDAGVATLWNRSYNLIYRSNSALEGLDGSPAIPDDVKGQLRGEALFIRALVHFYLVNLFGDVPYIGTTDYAANMQVARLPVAEVYGHIVADLVEAKSLLGEGYVSGERTRANKWAAVALLSRTYLYAERWQEAVGESSLLLEQTALFGIEEDIAAEFLKESSSAILQLQPKNAGSNSEEGSTFLFTSGPPPFVSLSSSLVEAMEPGDLRRTQWTGSVTDGSTTWYHPFKYRENLNTGSSREYSILFRVAEQHLIRAEALARLDDLEGAKLDLDRIRLRAGLGGTEAATGEAMLAAILKERRFELFAEHGHRWFDLRRYGVAGSVLAPVKPGWASAHVLLPIPEADLLANPNLEPQNVGY